MTDDGNKLTRETASALVDLLRTIRPAWDARATFDAIGEIRHRGTAAWVTYKALTVAFDPAAATPRALTFDAVWKDREPAAAPTVPSRMAPREFTVTNPAPEDTRAAAIAAARANIQPPPPEGNYPIPPRRLP